jgi:hypothetical protein
MEKRREESPPKSARNQRTRPPLFNYLSFLFLLALLSGGCAAPAEPIERKRPIPEAVTDLSAAQAGNEVILTFTLPKRTVEHHPLKQAAEVEIYRDFAPPSAAGGAPPAEPSNPTLLAAIPAAVAANYESQGQFRFADSLKAEDFSQHAGSEAIYMVRMRASRKAASANSNPVALRIYPAPEPIADVKVEVTHSGVVLTWTAPQKTIAGPAPEIAHYNIYRAEAVEGAPAAGAAQGPAIKSPLTKIGESESTAFRDRQAEFGKTYIYSVRSVAKYPDVALESADSNRVTVTPKDIFPPVAPQGLVVVYVPAVGGTPAHMELSWAINPETDIAGYNVYRSEQEGVPGRRLNPELLLTPAFRDMNAVPGRRYLYTVTAVDRAGNESPASAAASGGVPVEGTAAP